MALGGDMEKMKKLGALLLVLVIALSISTASAIVWEDYFDTPIFDGGVFVNDTTETDIPEEEEEIKKDWLERDERIFPPGYFNVTPRAEWTDKPANWFSETPREEYNLKPEGYWDVNTGLF